MSTEAQSPLIVAPAAVEYEDEQGVRLLTLNRPEVLNAFNQRLYDALTEALLAADSDNAVSVVVLTGAGRAFSTGTDLNELARQGDFRRGSSSGHGFDGLVETLIGLRKPLVCAVNGLAVGVGATVLGLADLVFMSESARVRCPFTALGLAPEAGSNVTLPRLVGRQHAAWMLLSSAWLDAAQCVQMGLAFQVVAPELLLPVALEHAREIAMHPLGSLIATKQLISVGTAEATRDAVRNESAAFDSLLIGTAHKEALRVFHARRSVQATLHPAEVTPLRHAAAGEAPVRDLP